MPPYGFWSSVRSCQAAPSIVCELEMAFLRARFNQLFFPIFVRSLHFLRAFSAVVLVKLSVLSRSSPDLLHLNSSSVLSALFRRQVEHISDSSFFSDCSFSCRDDFFETVNHFSPRSFGVVLTMSTTSVYFLSVMLDCDSCFSFAAHASSSTLAAHYLLRYPVLAARPRNSTSHAGVLGVGSEEIWRVFQLESGGSCGELRIRTRDDNAVDRVCVPVRCAS